MTEEPTAAKVATVMMLPYSLPRPTAMSRLDKIPPSAAPTKSAGPKTPPKKPKDIQAAVTSILAKKMISRK